MDNKDNNLQSFKASFNKLNSQLRSIKRFVETFEKCSDNFYQYKYNGVIISLYGNYEHFIDSIFSNLLDIYLLDMNIPDDLMKQYKKSFIDYISNPQRYTYLDIKEEDIVKEYFNILTSMKVEFKSKRLFLTHSGNMNSKHTFEFISHFIKDIKAQLIKDNLFKKFFINTIGKDINEFETLRRRQSDELFKYIDELVGQRNEIAHGADNDNRLDIQSIKDYNIPYFVCFCEIIFKIVCLSYVKSLNYQQRYKFDIIYGYDNKKLCFHINKNISFKINDYIIYTIEEEYRISKVVNIEIDSVKTEVIDDKDCDVVIEIDDKIKPDYQLIQVVDFI